MNESATARIEEFAAKGWGHTGLSRLAQDLIAEIAAYPATVPDGIEFGDAYALDGDPYDVPMEVGPVEIRDADSVIFTEPAAEFPAAWDATARQIVAQKYFYGDHSQGFRETSALQVVFRVSARIALWAVRKRTFATSEDACRFFIYLSHIQIQQEFAFNSPVYFNVGVDVYGAVQDRENFYFDESEGRVRPCSDSSDPHPMISACYIQSVDDNMPSIMALATSEAMLFKRGSGTGTDLSPLRSSREKLSGGGRPSGPVSYMKMYDSIAGIIKSGGRVRRAAKMQTLKYTHPDIIEFVKCKRKEEGKARTLIVGGYEANFNGEAYSTVAFQNANLSVRVDSELFRKAEAGESFDTIAVTTGALVDSIDASTFLRTVAECAWDCGDPALQFQDRIDEFHTVPNHGPNTSTNPCAEFVHIDNSSCNLGSLNAMKFLIPPGMATASLVSHDTGREVTSEYLSYARFDVAHFRRVSTVAAVAMETMVGAGSYPTEAIALNSHRFRPLGQGYANVGCYVMVSGHPYDSPDSRAIVAAMTSILTGKVYATSALLARRFGPFDGFAADRENMLAVMEKHREHAYRIDDSTPNDCSPAVAADPGLFRAARESWDEAIELGERHGYRNSQATCIAPTGTIAFMMGCDTLGIEPEIALVRFKALAGRGTLKLVNRSVRLALENLGYPGGLIDSIMNHIHRYNTIEDVVSNGGHAVAPSGLRSEHLPIFDCAFPPSPVTVDGYEWRPAWGRSIGIDGHVDMMAAATPLVSGAVSKTVNMSVSSTVDDILRVYKDAWRKGCKAIAVYRDGSKGSQPVTTSEVGEMKGEADSKAQADEKAIRRLKEVIAKLEHERELDQSVISDAREQIRIMASVLGEREAELRAIRRNNGPQPFPDGPRPRSADIGVAIDPPEVRAMLESYEVEIDGLRALKSTMQAANVRMHDELAAKNHEAANLRLMLGSAAPEPRFRMPVDRDAKIHKFNVSGHEGFITRGFTADGTLGEVFIEMSKQGSTIAGLMDFLGILISLALQHRVPVAKVVEKMEFQKFNPAGITTNRDIKFCSSIIDYVGRFLGIHHVAGYRERMRPIRSDGATPAEPMGVGAVDDVPRPTGTSADIDSSENLDSIYAEAYLEWNDSSEEVSDSVATEPGNPHRPGFAEDINNDPCPNCGSLMVRVQPNCMVCYGCGYVDGGCG